MIKCKDCQYYSTEFPDTLICNTIGNSTREYTDYGQEFCTEKVLSDSDDREWRFCKIRNKDFDCPAFEEYHNPRETVGLMTDTDSKAAVMECVWCDYTCTPRDNTPCKLCSNHSMNPEARLNFQPNQSILAAFAAFDNLVCNTGTDSKDRVVHAVNSHDALEKKCDRLREALEDMFAGWRYIRLCHGDLYGVEWDRVEDKATLALGPQDAGKEMKP